MIQRSLTKISISVKYFKYIERIKEEVYPRGVMVKSLDCGIVVSEFELQPSYYVHFRTNTFRKAVKSLILPAIG